MKQLLFLLIPFCLFSQSKLTKDSICFTVKMKIEKKVILYGDTVYYFKDKRIRITKDSLYFYDKRQYLKQVLKK
jgi:hypothetical protein